MLRTLACTSIAYLTLGAALVAQPPNIIFILCDDHRADAMGCAGHPWIETPHMDRMARDGAYFPKAMVTTSLCSPSRASILTGLYAHNHRVIDNYNPVDPKLVFFPQILQKAGYQTAFIGKWHMGDVDDPQRGFDHWHAFKGQGTYWPDGRGTTRVVPQTSYEGYNINGKRVPQKGYITDELTDYSLAWLDGRKGSKKPYFLYVSHKGVHSDFVPADRHLGRYKDKPFPTPPTMEDSDENYAGKPMWVRNQRNSRHGADFGYNLANFDAEVYYKRYCEALLAVDDAVGRTLKWLEDNGELDNTLLVYMGDNGFQFGEQGLIDKRTAYEMSIRVPLLMHHPAAIKKGTRVERAVANIDIAPTLLEAAGVTGVEIGSDKGGKHGFDGQSFWALAKGDESKWDRPHILYEYYWEWNYPHTPTMHALIGDRYKYIRYHGLWDLNEFYDTEEDPHEQRNLIDDPAQKERIAKLNTQLFEVLKETGGDKMPLLPDRGRSFPWRHPDKGKQASFPDVFIQEGDPHAEKPPALKKE